MLALYLACLGFGATVLVASLLLGGGKDTDTGGHADHTSDHDHPGELVNPFVSVRFWTFGLFTFGLLGSLLSWFSAPASLSFGAALVGGLAFGWVAALFFRMLHRDSVTGETGFANLVGEEGRVLVPIRPGGHGKIAIDRMSGRVELLAITQDHRMIDVGERVLIAAVSGGVADVSRTEPEADPPRRLQQPRDPERTTV